MNISDCVLPLYYEGVTHGHIGDRRMMIQLQSQDAALPFDIIAKALLTIDTENDVLIYIAVIGFMSINAIKTEDKVINEPVIKKFIEE